MRVLARLLFAVAGLWASAAGAAPPDPAPVIAAERAFAAETAATGVKPAFLKWSTEDAITVAGGPLSPKDAFAFMPDPTPGQSAGLAWWPRWAGIAASGDLGFTTGPVSENGKRAGLYLTVWRRQAGGDWKWVYGGGGGGGVSDTEPGPEAPVEPLASATAHAADAATAWSQVLQAEAVLSAGASGDPIAAHAAVLGDDARIYAAGLGPATTPQAARTALAGFGPTLAFGAPLGGEASQGGDLAWTYGVVSWAQAGRPLFGYYTHIWQNRAGGWRLVFSQFKPAEPQPPSPAGG